MARTSERRPQLALAALLALGAWPWISGLALWPMAPDSGLWIARGATFDPEWTRWVFATRHFHVGYRPVTALTYTLNFICGGLAPGVYRVTDLALHLAAAVAVFAVFRRMFRTASPWAAVLAAAIFLAHPAAEEVVPFIARRSYALSTALALAGLAAWLGPRAGSPPSTSLRPLAAGLLLTLALLSNEVAVLPIAALPLLAWCDAEPGPGRLRRASAGLFAPGMMLGAALLLRLWVVGSLGGYDTQSDGESRFVAVFGAVWRAAAGMPAASSPHGPALPWLLLAVALPFYGLRCLSGPPARRVLGLWILASAVLFALQEVWFPRQGYVLATPVALLAAHVFAETLTRARARRALELLPQALLLGSLLAGSAMLHGPDALRMREWRWRDALIDDMVADLGALSGPSDVQTVLPFRRGPAVDTSLKGNAANKALHRGARQPVTWVKLLLRERDLRLQEFAYVRRLDYEPLGPPELDLTTRPPTLVLPEQRESLLRRGARWHSLAADAERRIPFVPPRSPEGRAVYAYLAGVAGGELIPLD